jgi:hypothetical protein
MATKRIKSEGANKQGGAAPKQNQNNKIVGPPKASKNLKAKTKPITPAAPSAKRQLVSQEAIAIRAYLISEQRRSSGKHGDSLTDWLEAECQLLAELKK